MYNYVVSATSFSCENMQGATRPISEVTFYCGFVQNIQHNIQEPSKDFLVAEGQNSRRLKETSVIN